MWVAMSAAEREEFLAGVHVGVLSAAIGTAGQTLAVPVWYSYQPGGLLTVLTGRRSRKAAAIRAAGRFGLCVQDASPPYRYVNVEGPVVSEEELDPAERLAMARRYLGAAGGNRYVAGNPDPGRENVAFRMRPEHWLSQDQARTSQRVVLPLASSDVPSCRLCAAAAARKAPQAPPIRRLRVSLPRLSVTDASPGTGLRPSPRLR
jgi:hypothetical protein